MLLPIDCHINSCGKWFLLICDAEVGQLPIDPEVEEEQTIETEQVIDDNVVTEEIIEEPVLSDIEHDILPNEELELEQATPYFEEANPIKEEVAEIKEEAVEFEDMPMDVEVSATEIETVEESEEAPTEELCKVSDRRGKLPIWKLKMMEQQRQAEVSYFSRLSSSSFHMSKFIMWGPIKLQLPGPI